MAVNQQKRPKKSKPTYITSIISVSLILFVLGVIGLFFIQSARLAQTIKENVSVQLILKDNLNESDQFQLAQLLESYTYIKDVEIYNKAAAAEEMKADLGEDFIETIGYNPLPDAILVHLNANYSNADSMIWIKEELLASQQIVSVNYDEKLISNINNTSFKVLLGLLIFLGILLLISFIIIDNTIKLAMFSQRFVIRSMQLVGAKSWFITKPYVLRSLYNGLVSAIIASLLILGGIFLFEKYVLSLNIMKSYTDFILIFGLLVIIGLIISLISTIFAVRKYLKMKLDDLY